MHGATHYVMSKSIAKRCSPKCNICGESILVGEKVVSKVSRYNHSRTWYHPVCHNNMYFPFRGKQGIVVIKQRDR